MKARVVRVVRARHINGPQWRGSHYVGRIYKFNKIYVTRP